MTIRRENIFILIFFIIIFLFSIRGLSGNPTQEELRNSNWSAGPFESSNSRGRYALLYSLMENHSFQFSTQLAEFASPDLAYTNGQFVSLFAPGVSFLTIPGYLIGKHFGNAQVGTFSIIAVFAIVNAFLIKKIATYLGAHRIAAIFGAFAFLFASPAFSYATTLFQHHISTFFILLALYLLIRFNTLLALSTIWLLCVVAITVDYPNLFMMLPIAFVALSKMIVIARKNNVTQIIIHFAKFISFAAVILPLGFFLWFNHMSFGNPLQLSGTLERVTHIKDGKPAPKPTDLVEVQTASSEKTGLTFFKNRNILNGFYVHFFSPDRGMLRFTPVLLLGFVGLFLAVKKKVQHVGLLTAIIGFNVLLYAMWDDPYGGWAFGSRYLIPAYAIFAIFVSLLLTFWKRYDVFLLFFFALLMYSQAVNSLGALTSNSNPPKVEILALEKQTNQKQEYTYARNILELHKNYSQAYMFQTFAKKHITAWEYYIAFTIFITIISATLLIYFKVVIAKGENYAT